MLDRIENVVTGHGAIPHQIQQGPSESGRIRHAQERLARLIPHRWNSKPCPNLGRISTWPVRNRSTPELRNDTLCADRLGVHVAESNHHPEQEAQKRRTTRIVQAVPLTVTGMDALGRPFQERTSTLIINCHGARYQSKHYVLKNMWVTLEVPHNEPGHPARSVRGRVTWIQRPRTVRELFQIGIELEVAGNVWGIAFPPSDWFPFPEGGAAPNMEIPGPSESLNQAREPEDWSTTEV